MIPLHIGTCSWKYPSWHGLVYSAPEGINYLSEYSAKYDTVEVDQWFWSLFGKDKIGLPNPKEVAEYRKSVPDTFIFTVKVPNSITLTHFYRKNKQQPLVKNPHFLSSELFNQFMKHLQLIDDLLGPLMFQFEYLNKQKMSSQHNFQSQFEGFLSQIGDDHQLAVEIRNPNYLNESFFKFLNKYSLCPVLLQGYYMPSILDIYTRWKSYLVNQKCLVIRLHGPDRKDMENKTGSRWSTIASQKDEEIEEVVDMVTELRSTGIEVFINVNNHYEGSAPLTIEKIRKAINVR